MKKTAFTIHDINEELILSVDSYLRTVIINKKRHYFRKITKLSRNGITMLELEKYESNLTALPLLQASFFAFYRSMEENQASSTRT